MMPTVVCGIFVFLLSFFVSASAAVSHIAISLVCMPIMIDVLSFRHLLLRCFNNNVPQRVMVALSGGVDSMCLTYLLSQYKVRYHPSLYIHAVTIDHGYRAGSGREAAKVGYIVEKWGVEHSISRLAYGRNVHEISNFEEVARDMRYKVFQQECDRLKINALLVGHTLDDKLETYLQRLQMNSTIYGLEGLKSSAPFPRPPISPYDHPMIYRPLLLFEKLQLQSTCKEANIEWFEDYTNQDRWLTKRNTHRYMINYYVPRHVHSKPELVPLSKPALLYTNKLIETLLGFLVNKVDALSDYMTKYGDVELQKDRAHIKFSIPVEFWKRLHPLVISRWIYTVMYPLSSAKHFHWSYAKIERGLIPRIDRFLNGPVPTTKLTYLNVVFSIDEKSGTLSFTLSKQPPIRSSIPDLRRSLSATSTFSSWILYDNTWWLRIRHIHGKVVKIVPYHLLMRKNVQKAFPDLQALPPGNCTIPIILDEASDDILALPTYGLVRENLEIECVFKS